MWVVESGVFIHTQLVAIFVSGDNYFPFGKRGVGDTSLGAFISPLQGEIYAPLLGR